jgi:hypothetical protein
MFHVMVAFLFAYVVNFSTLQEYSILYVFPHLITDSNGLTVLFINNTNLDDTKQYLMTKQQI